MLEWIDPETPQGVAIATQFNDLGFFVAPDFAPRLFWGPIQILANNSKILVHRVYPNL